AYNPLYVGGSEAALSEQLLHSLGGSLDRHADRIRLEVDVLNMPALLHQAQEPLGVAGAIAKGIEGGRRRIEDIGNAGKARRRHVYSRYAVPRLHSGARKGFLNVLAVPVETRESRGKLACIAEHREERVFRQPCHDGRRRGGTKRLADAMSRPD